MGLSERVYIDGVDVYQLTDVQSLKCLGANSDCSNSSQIRKYMNPFVTSRL